MNKYIEILRELKSVELLKLLEDEIELYRFPKHKNNRKD